jgi:hypothetical protein
MTTIKAEVDELNQINIEIKRNLDSVKKLREKKKVLETNIAAYLNEREIPGVKYNGDVILLQRKNKTILKSKKTRDVALLDLLRDSGVKNPDELVKQLKSIGKESITMETIKINKND